MTPFTRIFLLFTTMGLLLFACSPEKVGPGQTGNNQGPDIAGHISEHPALEVLCSSIDTITLWSEEGFAWCNKCYDMFGFVRPCDAQDSATSWGNVVLMNGLDSIDTDNDQNYDDAENVFVANVTMAAGWFILANQSQFSTSNNWVINNGIIQITNDWLSTNLGTAENAWQLRKKVADLPPCFDIALHLQVVSLDLFSSVIDSSLTSIWGHNPNWNNPSHHNYSPISPFLTHFCPDVCGTPCIADSVCKTVYTGLTCNSGCTTLSPALTGPGPFTYQWSTGATSASISVCPTVNTTYSVSVTHNGGCIATRFFNVKAVNVACSIPQLARVEFCPVNLNLRYNQTFNIRNYVRHANGNAVYAGDWSKIVFTYTTMGANLPTSPANWRLADFMAGNNVTVTAADAAAGKGNTGTAGQYRIYIGREGQATYDDYMTIRVNNSQPSSLTTAVCSYGPSCAPSGGGTPTPGVKICFVPPGNPGGASTTCVPATTISNYVTNYCTGQTMTAAQPGYSLGQCGSSCF
jgi:hypothetical protein